MEDVDLNGVNDDFYGEIRFDAKADKIQDIQLFFFFDFRGWQVLHNNKLTGIITGRKHVDFLITKIRPR